MICRERAAIIRQMVRERGRLQIRRILLNYTIALILFHGFGSRLGCLCLWKQVTQLVSLLSLLFNVLNLSNERQCVVLRIECERPRVRLDLINSFLSYYIIKN